MNSWQLIPDIWLLIAMLFVILAAAELFTNALEHIGEKLNISEGVTGSLFAAVGTALPETMVPLLALLAGTSNAQMNAEIGAGAILGAPLMLSTLSVCLMALAVLKSRGIKGKINPEKTGFCRDLDFFLGATILAGAALFIPPSLAWLRAFTGIALVLTYFLYMLLTLQASAKLVEDGHVTQAHQPLFLSRLGAPESLPFCIVQIALGLGLLILGVKGFIYGVAHVSGGLGVSPLLLSLLIIPIATELPEKINSILWARRGKDTLACGNITGAMVFQGTLLPALGILLTPWQSRLEVVASIAVTLLSAGWMRYWASKNRLTTGALLLNGLLYAGYIALVLR